MSDAWTFVRPVPLLELLDHDRDRVRHLLPGHRERLLAHDLGETDLERLIGELAVRVVAPDPRGGARAGDREASPTPRAVLAETGTISSKSPRSAAAWSCGTSSRLRSSVELVDRAERRHADRPDLPLVHEGVAAADPVRRVHHHDDRVHALRRLADEVVQPRAEERPRLVEPRRVGEHDLVAVGGQDGAGVVARRLRLVRDDGHLPSDERVDQRRLADVRPADDGDEAAAEARTSAAGSTGRRRAAAAPGAATPPVCRPRSRTRPAWSGPNSFSTCRHPPHGGVGSSSSATTAIDLESSGRRR